MRHEPSRDTHRPKTAVPGSVASMARTPRRTTPQSSSMSSALNLCRLQTKRRAKATSRPRVRILGDDWVKPARRTAGRVRAWPPVCSGPTAPRKAKSHFLGFVRLQNKVILTRWGRKQLRRLGDNVGSAQKPPNGGLRCAHNAPRREGGVNERDAQRSQHSRRRRRARTAPLGAANTQAKRRPGAWRDVDRRGSWNRGVHHVDVVVVDLHLGETSGLAVIRALRAVDAALSVVLTTGGSPPNKLVDGHVFLRKPFCIDSLAAAIMECSNDGHDLSACG